MLAGELSTFVCCLNISDQWQDPEMYWGGEGRYKSSARGCGMS